MASEHAEAEWLTEDCEFSLEELVDLSGLPETELRELVDYGAISPVDAHATQWVFKGRCLTTVRAACRLRVSFELEPHGVALVMSLLERIRELESQIESVRAQAPRRIR